MKKKFLICSSLFLTLFNHNILASNYNHIKNDVSNVSQAISDTAITAKIKALYAQSALVNITDIAVKTINQRVELTGLLDTTMQYEQAIVLAESVPGVKNVDIKNLQVKRSHKPLNDLYLTAKIKGVLLRDSLFGKQDVKYWPIHIETKNGVVYIKGTVDTKQQKNNVVKAITSIEGVKRIKTAISIQQ